MGRIDRWCIMCGAAPGEPCTVISGGDGLNAGDVRPQVHFYRFSTEKPAVTVSDEPDFASLLDLDPAMEADG